jgi:ribosomal RNA-processing protein 1
MRLGLFGYIERSLWCEADDCRMDKFLYLVRCYLHTSFRQFARKGWKDTRKLDEYMEILRRTPLNPTDRRVPDGLRMHVLDIYVDELDNVDEKKEGKMPLDTLLAPVREMGSGSESKSIRKHVKEALEDKRLLDWNGEGIDKKQAANGAAEGDDEEWGGLDD